MIAESGKTRKREEAIAALLACSTIEAAAKAVGISEPTLLRWLKEEEFSAAYRAARRQSVNVAVTRLQQASSSAVETLVSIMQDAEKPGSVRLSAARSVLEFAIKAGEMQELEERMQELEATLERMAKAAEETE